MSKSSHSCRLPMGKDGLFPGGVSAVCAVLHDGGAKCIRIAINKHGLLSAPNHPKSG